MSYNTDLEVTLYSKDYAAATHSGQHYIKLEGLMYIQCKDLIMCALVPTNTLVLGTSTKACLECTLWLLNLLSHKLVTAATAIRLRLVSQNSVQLSTPIQASTLSSLYKQSSNMRLKTKNSVCTLWSERFLASLVTCSQGSGETTLGFAVA